MIEPSVQVSRKTRIDNAANIIVLEGTDYAAGGHTEITYALNNRLYAKKESSREIVSVGLQQTYYTDDKASTVDFNYQSTANGALPPRHYSPLALQVHVTPTTATDGTVRAEYDTHTNSLRSVAANGGVSAGWTVVNAGWSVTHSVPTRITDPVTTVAHALNGTAIVRKPGNAWSGVYAFNYDVKQTAFINQRIIAHYNTQCCGLAVEYQKFNFGTRAGAVGLPKDHRFNLSFTLAGIGTFSDLFGAFGGQQGR